jgi:hypothetical protein
MDPWPMEAQFEVGGGLASMPVAESPPLIGCKVGPAVNDLKIHVLSCLNVTPSHRGA